MSTSHLPTRELESLNNTDLSTEARTRWSSRAKKTQQKQKQKRRRIRRDGPRKQKREVWVSWGCRARSQQGRSSAKQRTRGETWREEETLTRTRRGGDLWTYLCWPLDLPMLTFDLPMLTFDLPKRSVLQKEANLGRSKVTTSHGTWWPLIYLGLLSAEISVFFLPPPKLLPILTSSCQKKTLKTWNCWTAIFMILKPDMFFLADAFLFLSCFSWFSFFFPSFSSSSSSCFLSVFISDFLHLLLWLRSKRKIETERKRERKERKEERQKGRKERKTERKKSRKRRKEEMKERKERKEAKKGMKER